MSKLRRGQKKDGRLGKGSRALLARIKDWEGLPDNERKAYRKPGRAY